MSPRNAHEALTPDPALVERFRRDLSLLFNVDHDRLVVAVSGGADSLALLLLAAAVLGDRCLAATVDHRLRAGSAGEAALVAGICAARDIDHVVLTGPLPDRAGRTANISARARLLRYRLLEEHAAEAGACHVATAHHADDQLETLIMRLNRGAGVAGLAGVRLQGGRVIRPLLGWRKRDLADLARACGLDAVEDPTNVDDRFDRARLRKELAGVSWLDVDRIAASARALGEAEDALAWSARHLARDHCAFEPSRAVLKRDGLPPEYLRRLVIRCLEHVDPTIELTGPGVIRMIQSLLNSRRATLGRVIGEEIVAGHRHDWVFRPAPSRRHV